MNGTLIGAHGRARLISHVTSQVTQGGSVDFGQFETDRYSRFTGYLVANSVGNTGLAFRYRFGAESGGPFLVGSSIVVTSGNGAYSGSVLDIVNYGRYGQFVITTVDSTTQYSILLLGEPVR